MTAMWKIMIGNYLKYAQGEIHDLSEGCEEGRGNLFAEVAFCPALRRPLRVITLAGAKQYGFTVDDLKGREGLKEFFGFTR